MNLTYIGSRWTTTPNICIKSHFVRKLSCEHVQWTNRTISDHQRSGR